MPDDPTATDEATLRQADAAARELACTEFERPLVLEAGAGTGKTSVLVARFVIWIVDRGWEAERHSRGPAEWAADETELSASVLERTVAVTFTERAAAEMEQRIVSSLTALACPREKSAEGGPAWWSSHLRPPMDEVSRRARFLLDNSDQLRVSTIHGYCRRLLATHVREAKIHPDFTVDADGTEVAAIVDEVVREQLQQRYGSEIDPAFVSLAARGVGPAELASAVADLVAEGVSTTALESDPYGPEAVRQAARRFADALEQLIGPLSRAVAARRRRSLAAAAESHATAIGLVRRLGETVDAAGLGALVAPAAVQGLQRSLGRWASGQFNADEFEQLGDQRQPLQAAAELARRQMSMLQRLGERNLLPQAFAALAPLLGQTRTLMHARGVLGFPELLQRTHELLRNNAAVLAQVRRTISQLLVDEFQDTDPLQGEIVNMLALPREGTGPGLFVVGDPKQSIYGWRDADMAAYERLVDTVLGLGGSRATLAVNFRSTSAVLREVDRIIAPLMRHEPGVQPQYQRLVAGTDALEQQRECEAALSPGVEYWLACTPTPMGQQVAVRTSAEQARMLEAALLARDLRRQMDAGEQSLGRLAVLMRSTTHQETYLRALRQHGVPYAVGRDRSYFRRREIMDASVVLRAIVDRYDALALLALFRLPIAGVPDIALIPLWRRGIFRACSELSRPNADTLSAIDRIVFDVAEGLTRQFAPECPVDPRWTMSVRTVVRKLAELRHSLARDPADEFMALVRRLLSVEHLEASRFLGEYRWANLEQFYKRIQQGLVDSGGGPHAVVREIRRSLAENREESDAPVGDAAADAVRVMSIHQAKGLTFDQVFVVGLHSTVAASQHSRISDAARWADGWQMSLFGWPTLDFDLVERQRERVRRSEAVRALYVALTRPRLRLVLSGRWPERHQEPAPSDESYMALLQRALVRRPDFSMLPDLDSATPGAGDGVILTEPAGQRWRIATEDGSVAESGPAAAQSTEATSLLVAEHTTLQQRRADARGRMGLTLVSTASGPGAGASDGIRADAGRDGQGPSAEVAAAVGAGVHRILQCVDLGEQLRTGLMRQVERVPGYLPRELSEAAASGATDLIRQLLGRLAHSAIGARLERIRSHILGREVPLLMYDPEQGAPSKLVSGTMDLLYTDPDTQELVVVDYKTDRIGSGAVHTHASRYDEQLACYRAAVSRTLGRHRAPRVELWFLWPDVIVATDASGKVLA